MDCKISSDHAQEVTATKVAKNSATHLQLSSFMVDNETRAQLLLICATYSNSEKMEVDRFQKKIGQMHAYAVVCHVMPKLQSFR